jgi:hypothetical protein
MVCFFLGFLSDILQLIGCSPTLSCMVLFVRSKGRLYHLLSLYLLLSLIENVSMKLCTKLL